MLRTARIFLLWISVILGTGFFVLPRVARSETRKPTTALLVDKKTHTLYVTEYVDGVYHTVKTFHVTLGLVKGDKEDERDLKTPEGIYTFKAYLTPPSLQPKFGSMAFYLNYPNAYDQLAGRSGFGIMLHSTNEPDRLKQNYDSQGCIVLKNNEIQEVKPYIRLGLTPILIFPESMELSLVNNEYLKPGSNVELKAFFESWIQSWETKDLDHYIDHYHSAFSANGKDKAAWKKFKASLNAHYSSIKIIAEDVRYYRHPKYSMITFTQKYSSKIKGGGWGHRSSGTKILYVAEEAGKPKIIAETFSNLRW